VRYLVREPKCSTPSSSGPFVPQGCGIGLQVKDRAIPSPRLTLPEASEYLNIPVNSLRWFRTCGTGPRSYKLGGKVFYDRGDLDAWVEAAKAATVRGGVQ
jgi:predicted DNA-binding transcriptional regulator AlpA